MQIVRKFVFSAAIVAFLFFHERRPLPEGGNFGSTTEDVHHLLKTLTSDGKLTGFYIDIDNALCAHMKVECEWVA